MNPIRRSAFFFCPIVFLVAQCCPPARGDALLNYQFSGEIIEVDDQFGLFGQQMIGELFSINAVLCNGDLTANNGGIAEYFVDTVSQSNRFSAIAGTQNWQPASGFRALISGPASGLVGVTFLLDLDESNFDLSGAPNGFAIFDAAVGVELLSTNLSLATSYPDLPDLLNPLAEYDYSQTFLLYVNYFNTIDGSSGTSAVIGQVNLLQAVPEPSAAFLVSLIGFVGLRRRRNFPRSLS